MDLGQASIRDAAEVIGAWGEDVGAVGEHEERAAGCEGVERPHHERAVFAFDAERLDRKVSPILDVGGTGQEAARDFCAPVGLEGVVLADDRDVIDRCDHDGQRSTRS